VWIEVPAGSAAAVLQQQLVVVADVVTNVTVGGVQNEGVA
jgi:hypothetical protein